MLLLSKLILLIFNDYIPYYPPTLVSGSYIFIETSAPQKKNDTAVLYSPTFNANSQQCLRFFYHMYGVDIGILRVQVCVKLMTFS